MLTKNSVLLVVIWFFSLRTSLAVWHFLRIWSITIVGIFGVANSVWKSAVVDFTSISKEILQKRRRLCRSGQKGPRKAYRCHGCMRLHQGWGGNCPSCGSLLSDFRQVSPWIREAYRSVEKTVSRETKSDLAIWSYRDWEIQNGKLPSLETLLESNRTVEVFLRLPGGRIRDIRRLQGQLVSVFIPTEPLGLWDNERPYNGGIFPVVRKGSMDNMPPKSARNLFGSDWK